MTYLKLIVLLTQLSINESPTFCLLFFASLRKKEKDMGTEEEKKMKDGRPSELLPWLQ